MLIVSPYYNVFHPHKKLRTIIFARIGRIATCGFNWTASPYWRISALVCKGISKIIHDDVRHRLWHFRADSSENYIYEMYRVAINLPCTTFSHTFLSCPYSISFSEVALTPPAALIKFWRSELSTDGLYNVCVKVLPNWAFLALTCLLLVKILCEFELYERLGWNYS